MKELIRLVSPFLSGCTALYKSPQRASGGCRQSHIKTMQYICYWLAVWSTTWFAGDKTFSIISLPWRTGRPGGYMVICAASSFIFMFVAGAGAQMRHILSRISVTSTITVKSNYASLKATPSHCYRITHYNKILCVCSDLCLKLFVAVLRTSVWIIRHLIWIFIKHYNNNNANNNLLRRNFWVILLTDQRDNN